MTATASSATIEAFQGSPCEGTRRWSGRVGSASVATASPLAGGLLRLLFSRTLGRRLDRAPRLSPGAEAALDMRNRRQPHVLHRLRCEGRAHAAGAEEDEALLLL